MSLDSKELLVNFENGTVINITSLTPQPSGSVEHFNFTPENLTIKNGTVLYFSLVAIDKANLKSEPSNLARAIMFIPPPPQPKPSPKPSPTTRPGNSAMGVTGTLSIIILTLVTALTGFHI